MADRKKHILKTYLEYKKQAALLGADMRLAFASLVFCSLSLLKEGEFF